MAHITAGLVWYKLTEKYSDVCEKYDRFLDWHEDFSWSRVDFLDMLFLGWLLCAFLVVGAIHLYLRFFGHPKKKGITGGEDISSKNGESLEWLNSALSWLFHHYNNTPEFVDAWIRALNDQSRKQQYEYEIKVDGIQSGSPPPKLKYVATKSSTKDYLTIQAGVESEGETTLLVSAIQKTPSSIRVTNCDVAILKLKGQLKMNSSYNSGKQEISINLCFASSPEISLQVRPRQIDSKIKLKTVEDAVKSIICSSVTSITLPSTGGFPDFYPPGLVDGIGGFGGGSGRGGGGLLMASSADNSLLQQQSKPETKTKPVSQDFAAAVKDECSPPITSLDTYSPIRNESMTPLEKKKNAPMISHDTKLVNQAKMFEPLTIDVSKYESVKNEQLAHGIGNGFSSSMPQSRNHQQSNQPTEFGQKHTTASNIASQFSAIAKDPSCYQSITANAPIKPQSLDKSSNPYQPQRDYYKEKVHLIGSIPPKYVSYNAKSNSSITSPACNTDYYQRLYRELGLNNKVPTLGTESVSKKDPNEVNKPKLNDIKPNTSQNRTEGSAVFKSDVVKTEDVSLRKMKSTYVECQNGSLSDSTQSLSSYSTLSITTAPSESIDSFIDTSWCRSDATQSKTNSLNSRLPVSDSAFSENAKSRREVRRRDIILSQNRSINDKKGLLRQRQVSKTNSTGSVNKDNSKLFEEKKATIMSVQELRKKFFSSYYGNRESPMPPSVKQLIKQIESPDEVKQKKSKRLEKLQLLESDAHGRVISELNYRLNMFNAKKVFSDHEKPLADAAAVAALGNESDDESDNDDDEPDSEEDESESASLQDFQNNTQDITIEDLPYDGEELDVVNIEEVDRNDNSHEVNSRASKDVNCRASNVVNHRVSDEVNYETNHNVISRASNEVNHRAPKEVKHRAYNEVKTQRATNELNQRASSEKSSRSSNELSHRASNEVRHKAYKEVDRATNTDNHRASNEVDSRSCNELSHRASNGVKHKAYKEVNHRATNEENHRASNEVDSRYCNEVNHRASNDVKHKAYKEANHRATNEENHRASNEVDSRFCNEVNHRASNEVNNKASNEVNTSYYQPKYYSSKGTNSYKDEEMRFKMSDDRRDSVGAYQRSEIRMSNGIGNRSDVESKHNRDMLMNGSNRDELVGSYQKSESRIADGVDKRISGDSHKQNFVAIRNGKESNDAIKLRSESRMGNDILMNGDRYYPNGYGQRSDSRIGDGSMMGDKYNSISSNRRGESNGNNTVENTGRNTVSSSVEVKRNEQQNLVGERNFYRVNQGQKEMTLSRKGNMDENKNDVRVLTVYHSKEGNGNQKYSGKKEDTVSTSRYSSLPSKGYSKSKSIKPHPASDVERRKSRPDESISSNNSWGDNSKHSYRTIDMRPNLENIELCPDDGRKPTFYEMFSNPGSSGVNEGSDAGRFPATHLTCNSNYITVAQPSAEAIYTEKRATLTHRNGVRITGNITRRRDSRRRSSDRSVSASRAVSADRYLQGEDYSKNYVHGYDRHFSPRQPKPEYNPQGDYKVVDANPANSHCNEEEQTNTVNSEIKTTGSKENEQENQQQQQQQNNHVPSENIEETKNISGSSDDHRSRDGTKKSHIISARHLDMSSPSMYHSEQRTIYEVGNRSPRTSEQGVIDDPRAEQQHKDNDGDNSQYNLPHEGSNYSENVEPEKQLLLTSENSYSRSPSPNPSQKGNGHDSEKESQNGKKDRHSRRDSCKRQRKSKQTKSPDTPNVQRSSQSKQSYHSHEPKVNKATFEDSDNKDIYYKPTSRGVTIRRSVSLPRTSTRKANRVKSEKEENNEMNRQSVSKSVSFNRNQNIGDDQKSKVETFPRNNEIYKSNYVYYPAHDEPMLPHSYTNGNNLMFTYKSEHEDQNSSNIIEMKCSPKVYKAKPVDGDCSSIKSDKEVENISKRVSSKVKKAEKKKKRRDKLALKNGIIGRPVHRASSLTYKSKIFNTGEEMVNAMEGPSTKEYQVDEINTKNTPLAEFDEIKFADEVINDDEVTSFMQGTAEDMNKRIKRNKRDKRRAKRKEAIAASQKNRNIFSGKNDSKITSPQENDNFDFNNCNNSNRMDCSTPGYDDYISNQHGDILNDAEFYNNTDIKQDQNFQYLNQSPIAIMAGSVNPCTDSSPIYDRDGNIYRAIACFSDEPQQQEYSDGGDGDTTAVYSYHTDTWPYLINDTDLIFDAASPGGTLKNRRLLVKVIKANGLGDKDFACSGPYCTVQADEPKQRHITSVVKNTVNPFWDEHFIFDLSDDTKNFKFEVYDREKTPGSDFLGRATIAMNELKRLPSSRQIIPLTGKPGTTTTSGSITVEFLFMEATESSQPFASVNREEMDGISPRRRIETNKTMTPGGTLITTSTTTTERPRDRNDPSYNESDPTGEESDNVTEQKLVARLNDMLQSSPSRIEKSDTSSNYTGEYSPYSSRSSSHLGAHEAGLTASQQGQALMHRPTNLGSPSLTVTPSEHNYLMITQQQLLQQQQPVNGTEALTEAALRSLKKESKERERKISRQSSRASQSTLIITGTVSSTQQSREQAIPVIQTPETGNLHNDYDRSMSPSETSDHNRMAHQTASTTSDSDAEVKKSKSFASTLKRKFQRNKDKSKRSQSADRATSTAYREESLLRPPEQRGTSNRMSGNLHANESASEYSASSLQRDHKRSSIRNFFRPKRAASVDHDIGRVEIPEAGLQKDRQRSRSFSTSLKKLFKSKKKDGVSRESSVSKQSTRSAQGALTISRESSLQPSPQMYRQTTASSTAAHSPSAVSSPDFPYSSSVPAQASPLYDQYTPR